MKFGQPSPLVSAPGSVSDSALPQPSSRPSGSWSPSVSGMSGSVRPRITHMCTSPLFQVSGLVSGRVWDSVSNVS